MGHRLVGILLGMFKPVNGLHTVHDRGGCCLLHCVLLDLLVGAPPTSIVNSPDLVPLVNGREWSGAKFFRVATTDLGSLGFGIRSLDHAKFDFFNKSPSHFGSEVFGRGVVFSP